MRKNLYGLLVFFSLIHCVAVAQYKPFVSNDVFQTQFFIENKGQFNAILKDQSDIDFAVNHGHDEIYLNKKGFKYYISKATPHKETAEEQRKEKLYDSHEEEEDRIKYDVEEDWFILEWIGANEKAEKLQFEIVNTIDGAVESLTKGESDYFMWERFMTKPLVDKGIFRRIDDCPTPWPCFVIAVREEILKKYPNAIAQILEIINITTQEFKEIPSIDRTLATKYHQKIEDIQEWLRLTEWSQKPLPEKMLNKIQNQLFDLKIIEKKGTFAELVKAI